jgi:hypothetical protein
VGRWTTRNPTRGHLACALTADSDSTSKCSPMVFGTTGRLGHPGTDWAATGNPNPAHQPPPSSAQRRGELGTRIGPEGYFAYNYLPTRKPLGGRPPSSAETPPPRDAGSKDVAGSYQLLGRCTRSWRGSPKDPHDCSVDSQSRRHLPRTQELRWIQSVAAYLLSHGNLVT